MKKRIFSAFLACSLIITSVLSGCSSKKAEVTETVAESIQMVTPSTEETMVTVAETVAEKETEATIMPTESTTETEATVPVTEPTSAVEIEPTIINEAEDALTPTQQNSINMLNYLAALVTEINESSSSRVYLEEVYSELINNSKPSTIDAVTLAEFEGIQDLLTKYRMIEVKRERLEYLHEQNRAAALRSAMPDPLSLLNVVQAGSNPLKMVASILYLTMDSATSYAEQSDAVELQYLQDDWVLDDEAYQELQNSRRSMFSYMVRIVDEYDIPDDLTLTESTVDNFVYWKNHENILRRIQFLEDNQDTYRGFGDYWLTLAESYYLNNEPQKCLDAIAQYRALNMNIFRKDYKFAGIVPYAIIAAKETLDEADYLNYAAEYTDILLDNAKQSDWEKWYFAAQVYLDLYAGTNNRYYLQKAYSTTQKIINEYLIDEQNKLNTSYLSKYEEIKEVETPKGASKEKKKDIKEQNKHIKDYNKQAKAEYKVALSPVYEPLRLCCDLLFGIADELNISETEQTKIETILHYQGENLFLDNNLDNMYRFDSSFENVEVVFEGDKFTIPAYYVSEISKICLTVDGRKITDWEVKEVDRNKTLTIQNFVVTYTSKQAKDIKFKDGSVATLEIFAHENASEPLRIVFDVSVKKVWKVSAPPEFIRR